MGHISPALTALIAAARASGAADDRHYREVYEPLERAESRAATAGAPAITIDPAVISESDILCAKTCEDEYAVADFPVAGPADFAAKIEFMVERKMFAGIDQGERLMADASRLAAFDPATPIQTLAKLRSDISDRQDAIDRPPGDLQVTLSRQLSWDNSRLLHVMLAQQPQSLIDVFSLVSGMAELASQEIDPDPENPDVKEIAEAGDLIQIAGTSIVAFLASIDVQPLNAYDRLDLRRCMRLSGERFPAPREAQA